METEKLIDKMKAEFEKYNQDRKRMEQELFEKDEELAKKDSAIKALT